MRKRAGSRFTDLLGELTELTATHLTVATSRGPVTVPLNEVHRAKRVPDVRGVELAAAEAMPAPVVEWLGQWRLRAAEGFTGRANSALPLGDPGMPVTEALEAVAAFYRRHGLRPAVDVPLPLGRPVARALEAHGWVRRGSDVLVRVIDIPDLVDATAGTPGEGFTLSSHPPQDMLTLLAARRGTLTPAAIHVLTAVPTVTFCGYREGGALLAIARGTVTRSWLGLFHIETDPAARRRGLARAAIGSLARWGRHHGARRVYLQVEATNEPANALYDSLGFTTHHSYVRYSRTA